MTDYKYTPKYTRKQLENIDVNPELQQLKLSFAIDAPEIKAGRKPNWKILLPELQNILTESVKLNTIIVFYNQCKSRLRYLQLIILTIYLIGWLYILITTIYYSSMQGQLTVIESLCNFGRYLNKEMGEIFINPLNININHG